MKQLKLLLLCLLIPAFALADDAWNTTYKQIEQSIRVPQFADKVYVMPRHCACRHV